MNASASAVDDDLAGVGHLGQRLAAERRHEEALDQGLGRLPAGAVGHRDLRVAELGAPAADVLDQPEDVLLPVGDRGPVAHHTTSRSRAKRPKL